MLGRKIANNQSSLSERIFGLDVLRAYAISSVLIGHSLNVFAYDFPILGNVHLCLASAGVDIFFALSGFLIGGILLRDLFPQPTVARLLKFWVWRWFRTLPNYYLWLFANILAVALFYHRVPNVRPYYFFTQSLTAPPKDYWFFGTSWSLVVEEWFYLLLPVSLIVFRKITRSWNQSALFTILWFAGGSFALRAGDVFQSGASWDALRKIALYRFDALMFGVLGAYAKRFHASGWQMLQRHGPYAACALCVGYAIALLYYPLDSVVGRVFLLSTVPAATFFVLPAMDGWRRPQGSGLLATKLSRWSYSLYLVHPFIYPFLWPTKRVSEFTFRERILFTATWMILSFIVAILNFTLFEHPAMRLREKVRDACRWLRSNCATGRDNPKLSHDSHAG